MTESQLSIIVAYRTADRHRERIFRWTCSRWRALFPDAAFIIGEEESTSGPFCLSECRNNGARKAATPFLLFADADAIGFRDAILDGMTLLALGAARVFPYGMYQHLTPESTTAVLSTPPRMDPRTEHSLTTKGSYPNSTSGLVLITADNFRRSGGFDQRFRSWGPEDQAFDEAVSTLCGPSVRVNTADLYHLWHPVKPGTTTDNPNYPASCELWDRYKAAAGDVAAMRELVSGR